VTAGTPAYMAPEIATGEEGIDGRVDLYGLGCVAYFLLTGSLVFDEKTGTAMAMAHVQKTPVPPSRRSEVPVPQQLEEIILRCLAKQPEQRPQSARELNRCWRLSVGCPNGPRRTPLNGGETYLPASSFTAWRANPVQQRLTAHSNPRSLEPLRCEIASQQTKSWRSRLNAGSSGGWKGGPDSLFLSNYPASDLPKVVIAAAAVTVALVLIFARAMRRFGPQRLVPAGFFISSMAHVAEYRLTTGNPALWCVLIYIHVVGGAILLSGFWSLMAESFDPHSAKQIFGRITAAGTLGGIAGGLMAERIAAVFSANGVLLLLAASTWPAQCAGVSAAGRPRSHEPIPGN
jgi:hypothetical protein